MKTDEILLRNSFVERLLPVFHDVFWHEGEFSTIEYETFADDINARASQLGCDKEEFLQIHEQILKHRLVNYNSPFPDSEKVKHFQRLARRIAEPSSVYEAQLPHDFVALTIKEDFLESFPPFSQIRSKKMNPVVFIKPVLHLKSLIEFDTGPRSGKINVYIGIHEPRHPLNICQFFGGVMKLGLDTDAQHFLYMLQSCLRYLQKLEYRVSTIIRDLQRQNS